MKYLLALFAMLVLSGCDNPIYKGNAVYYSFDEEKRERLFLSCVDKIKLTHEASLAGYDDALKVCQRTATDYSISDSVVGPYGGKDCKYHYGNVQGYCVVSPTAFQEMKEKTSQPSRK